MYRHLPYIESLSAWIYITETLNMKNNADNKVVNILTIFFYS